MSQWIVLTSIDNGGAGEAYGPYASKELAEQEVDKMSLTLDRQQEGCDVELTAEQRYNTWNGWYWIDIIKIRSINDWYVKNATVITT